MIIPSTHRMVINTDYKTNAPPQNNPNTTLRTCCAGDNAAVRHSYLEKGRKKKTLITKEILKRDKTLELYNKYNRCDFKSTDFSTANNIIIPTLVYQHQHHISAIQHGPVRMKRHRSKRHSQRENSEAAEPKRDNVDSNPQRIPTRTQQQRADSDLLRLLCITL